jgi:hypothetical protein
VCRARRRRRSVTAWRHWAVPAAPGSVPPRRPLRRCCSEWVAAYVDCGSEPHRGAPGRSMNPRRSAPGAAAGRRPSWGGSVRGVPVGAPALRGASQRAVTEGRGRLA